MNIFHKILELWPGHESGTYGRTDVRDGQGKHLMPFRYSSNTRGHKKFTLSRTGMMMTTTPPPEKQYICSHDPSFLALALIVSEKMT